MLKENLHGAPSFCLTNDLVSLAVTEAGGHMTAEFELGGRKVSPYARAPWLPDEIGGEMPVLLSHLRGDFFCLPFGPQSEGPPHGETANGEWKCEESPSHELRLSMAPGDPACKVVKSMTTREGHAALYLQNTVEGLTGDWSYGSHPILDFSEVEDGLGRVSTSAFRWGSTYHGVFADPVNQEYQSLRPGALFDSLEKVPMIDGGVADLTRYPARPGFEDLVMLVNDQGEAPFAWTACVLDGYVWFSLKKASDFPATLFWISNGGRHSEPWNGRHLKRLGLEEVCSYFCDEVETSRRDLLASDGVPTTRSFDGSPVSLKLIHAVALVPDEFDTVAEILPGEGFIELVARSGARVVVPLDWEFL
ncbi:MAG: hypothetical protein QNL33_15190 [Akkermansiaceae bacterium]|jgi:hypothetical protein